MPLIEAQPDALANVYARSLFELAEQAGGQAKAEEILGELEEILELARGDTSFNEFLASRVIESGKRDASLDRIFQGNVSELTLRFLRLLNDKGRLSHLAPIVGAYDQLVQEKFGRVEVDVFTSGPISSDELRSVKERLQGQLGKEVIVHPYTDSSMLGGIKLRIGDQLIDASVRTRLRKLRDSLSGKGNEIRSRAAELLEEAGE